MTEARIVLLSGGIGGAKLALGMSHLIHDDRLTIIVNTGDDFDHLGLRICPDIDTMLYTMAGIANSELGWGRRDETWTFMQVLQSLGGETWFRLGDGDLALHVERTRRLSAGESLSEMTDDIRRRWGIAARIAPMSDQHVATRVITPEGEIGFQEYFVKEKCIPVIKSVRFAGAEAAHLSSLAAAALVTTNLAAIIIAPSNPYLSIDPILAVPGMTAAMRAANAPVIAVTPLIEGRAVKGPTAKIMTELGVPPSPISIVQHYANLIDGFILDARDAALADSLGVPVRCVDTLMVTLDDRQRVAQAALDLAADVGRRRS